MLGRLLMYRCRVAWVMEGKRREEEVRRGPGGG
jgi:hypothetical protein